MTDVRCPRCHRYICSVPERTPVRAYCVKCGLKFEDLVREAVLTTPQR